MIENGEAVSYDTPEEQYSTDVPGKHALDFIAGRAPLEDLEPRCGRLSEELGRWRRESPASPMRNRLASKRSDSTRVREPNSGPGAHVTFDRLRRLLGGNARAFVPAQRIGAAA